MPHAERNLGDVSGASGYEDLERPAVPALLCVLLKGLYLAHQFLAIGWTEALLIRDGNEDSHGAIG